MIDVMGTHGTIAIRRKEEKDEVFVFHLMEDGSNVKDFMSRNKKQTSIDSLILDANRFCSDVVSSNRYSDTETINLYVQEFKKEEDYKDLTEESVYYDGKKWTHN